MELSLNMCVCVFHSKPLPPSVKMVLKWEEKATEMLIKRLELEDEEDEHYKTEIIKETNLIIRESTKCDS